MRQAELERAFAAEVASPGLATGPIALYSVDLAADQPAGTPEEERARLTTALDSAKAQLEDLMARSGDMGAEILEFQLALLEDPELIDPAIAAVGEGQGAAAAWTAVLDQQIADYEAAEEEYFRARTVDLSDLKERVLLLLRSGQQGQIESPEGAIYIAQDLTPSRFLETDWRHFAGAALVRGSASNHVAILARARGVPLLIGLEAAVEDLRDGATAVLDAEAGRLIQFPGTATLDGYRQRLAERAAEADAAAQYLAKPAITSAGERVQVLVNIDEPSILESLDPGNCDGVGLTRTEFLFTGPGDLPDEETQLSAYLRLLDWAGGKPVTIRTLDAGGDKPIPGYTPEQESNPFLGLRGLRLSLSRPEVFRVQLRALARTAATSSSLKVMVPMVTAPRELAEARSLFEAAVTELRSEGTAAELPALGMMVEVPAAALNIAAFDADFFSIGSNDLVQYVTATSRDSTSVSALYDPRDPGVIELIGRVAGHGKAAGREVSLCGDMASDPDILPALLDCGLRVVSVAPAALAKVKAGIARYG